MFNWRKKFSQDPDPLSPLGIEPRFLDPANVPHGSATVSIDNDDETKLEFVVQILNEYFGFKLDKAVEIAMKIHKEGSAEIRIMQSADADHVVGKAQQEAEKRGFPLKFRISPPVRP